MQTKQFNILCIVIFVSVIIHGLLVKPHRYIFSNNMGGNVGYCFDSTEGKLKIFPIGIGIYGHDIPYSTVDTKTMEFDTIDKDKKSLAVKEALRRVGKVLEETIKNK